MILAQSPCLVKGYLVWPLLFLVMPLVTNEALANQNETPNRILREPGICICSYKGEDELFPTKSIPRPTSSCSIRVFPVSKISSIYTMTPSILCRSPSTGADAGFWRGGGPI